MTLCTSPSLSLAIYIYISIYLYVYIGAVRNMHHGSNESEVLSFFEPRAAIYTRGALTKRADRF